MGILTKAKQSTSITHEMVKDLIDNGQCIRADLSNGMSVMIHGVGVQYGHATGRNDGSPGEEHPVLIGSYCQNSCNMVLTPKYIDSYEVCTWEEAQEIGLKRLKEKRMP